MKMSAASGLNDVPWTADDVREVLSHISADPPYAEWIKITGAVFDTLRGDEAIAVLRQWSPEKRKDEYAIKGTSGLKKYSIATLVWMAKQAGYDARGHWRRRFERLSDPEKARITPAVLTIAPREPQMDLTFDPRRLEEIAGRCPVDVSPEMLRQHSPVALPLEEDATATSRLFLESLFQPGERVILFGNGQCGPGSHVYQVGGGCYRIQFKTTECRPSAIPCGGTEGVFFLIQPSDGVWKPNSAGNQSIRSTENVTAWRYVMIESDDADPKVWLAAMVQMPLPIVALYTSGGRSIHMLCRFDAITKAALDERIDKLKHRLVPIGADPDSLTAVRLSRLPGALRDGKTDRHGRFTRFPDGPRRQRLLWLDPHGATRPILKVLNGRPHS